VIPRLGKSIILHLGDSSEGVEESPKGAITGKILLSHIFKYYMEFLALDQFINFHPRCPVSLNKNFIASGAQTSN